MYCVINYRINVISYSFLLSKAVELNETTFHQFSGLTFYLPVALGQTETV